MDKEPKLRFKLAFQEIDLPVDGLMIGRSPDCTLTLDDPLVSRHHARVSVESGGVYLDDLGSRNGTLVNGRPASARHKLSHQDRVRIGGHEMVFVVEGMSLDTRDRPTFALTTCSACGTPFPERAVACPHCGVRSGHQVRCGTCDATATSDSAFCAQCGAALEGNTGPLQVSEDIPAWTDRLVEEVIDRAIAGGRFDQAAKMLDDRAALLDDLRPGASRTRSLVWFSQRSVRVAKEMVDCQRLEAVVARWRIDGIAMPQDLLELLVEAAREWCRLRPALQSYWAAVISPRLPGDDEAARLDSVLSHLLRATEEPR